MVLGLINQNYQIQYKLDQISSEIHSEFLHFKANVSKNFKNMQNTLNRIALQPIIRPVTRIPINNNDSSSTITTDTTELSRFQNVQKTCIICGMNTNSVKMD